MSDEEPNPSEKAVTDQLGEVAEDQIERATRDARSHPAAEAARDAMQDPSEHGGAADPGSAEAPGGGNPQAMAADMGVSSGATTSDHPQPHDARDVSPGSHQAPDPASMAEDDAEVGEDYRNRSWDGPMRVGDQPRPSPIEDEKSRRDNIKPD